MPTNRHRETLSPQSQILDWLVRAAKHRGNANRASALLLYGELALATIPLDGIFAPAEKNELYTAIDRIATKHLGFRDARRAMETATDALASFEMRDAIVSAQIHVQTLSNEAYFYVGLAFGVIFAERCGRR